MMTLGVACLFQATILAGCCETTEAEAILRIGSLHGPVETILDRVSAIDIGNDGSLYVLESRATEIRVFSPNGDFVRTIARRGDGPGELRAPIALGVRDDSVWVFDGAAQKIEWFMVDGRHVTSLTFNRFTSNLPRVAPVGQFADGRFLVRRVSSHSEAMQQDQMERSFFVADVTNRQIDTLVVGHVEHGWMTLNGVTGPNSAFVGINPLARQDQIYVQPSADYAVMLNQTTVAGGSNEQFELAKMDAIGRVVWRRRFELPFARDVESVVSDIVEERMRMATSRMPEQVRRTFQERVYRDALRKALQSVGDRAGLVERMLMDSNGRIWLMPSPVATSPDVDTGEVWYVLDAEGEPLGTVTFPASMLRLLTVRGGKAFGVTLGEFDEQYVTTFAFRLERAETGQR